MYKNKTVVAILPAAGSGKRMNAGFNKVWLEVGGEKVLLRTLRVFLDNQYVDEIVLVANQEELSQFGQFLNNQGLNINKPVSVTAGGKERSDSVFNGLGFIKNKLTDDEENVIVAVHDAARALLTDELLTRSIIAAAKDQAIGVGTPVKDTIKQVDAEGFVRCTPERSSLWAIQTPQVFDFKSLYQCYNQISGSGQKFPDDCSVVEYCGYSVKLILGSYDNIKLTTPDDLAVAEAILKRRDS